MAAKTPTHTQPHHHVYYLCEQAIVRNLKVEAVLPHLLEKKVVPESDTSLYTGKPRNGMKILIGYLRNKSFETFLDFVEAILLAQGDDPSKAQSVTVVDSIIRAMREYDQRNDTHWVDDVVAIQKMYVKTTVEEESVSETSQTVDVEKPALEPAASGDATHRTGRLSMPDLDYIEEPHQHSFQCEGGTCDFFEEKYGFYAVVPPFAVPEGREIKVKFGLCCCGPFSINERYLLASDFAVIVADSEFSKPVEVFMDHCLILPEYRKCSEVLILKADHRKVTKDGLYTFDRFTIPDIDPSFPKLSFETEEFCILCSVLESPVGDDAFTSTSSSASGRIDDDNPSSAASSFEKSYSAGSPSILRVPSTSSDTGDMEVSELSPTFSRKRKSETLNEDELPKDPTLQSGRSGRSVPKAKSKRANMKRAHQGAGPVKRRYAIAYAALLLQPKKKSIEHYDDLYQFMIFICPNCPVAHKKCIEQAEARLKLELEPNPIPIVLCTKNGAIKMHISEASDGWKVKPDKTPTVSKREFGFGFMSVKELSERIEQKTCPPRIVYSAAYDDKSGTNRRFSCTIKLEGVTTETGVQEEEGEEVFFNISASIQPPCKQLIHQDRMDMSYSMGRYLSYPMDVYRHDYPPVDCPPGYAPAHHQMQFYNPPPMGRDYPQQSPTAPMPGYVPQYYGYPPNQSFPPAAPGANRMPTKASSLENIPRAPNASQQWKYPEGFIGRLGHSQEYSDSPLPSDEGHIPLSPSSPSRSQESTFMPWPTQSLGHEIQQDSSPIVSNFRGLTLNGNRNLAQLPLDASSPDRMRSGSCGTAELSQSSSTVNVQLNYIQNVIISPDTKESGFSSPCPCDLSHYESQLSSEEKEKPLLQMVYLKKCVPHIKYWKNIARVGFDLTDAQIVQLENDHGRSGSQECACKAYLKWRMESDAKPVTVWEMVQILYTSQEFEAIVYLLGLEKSEK